LELVKSHTAKCLTIPAVSTILLTDSSASRLTRPPCKRRKPSFAKGLRLETRRSTWNGLQQDPAEGTDAPHALDGASNFGNAISKLFVKAGVKETFDTSVIVSGIPSQSTC